MGPAEREHLTGTDVKQSISTLSWFWLQKWLLCGRIFSFIYSITIYCLCSKILKNKKAKINLQSSKWQTVITASVLFLPMLACLPSDLIHIWWNYASPFPSFLSSHVSQCPPTWGSHQHRLWSKNKTQGEVCSELSLGLGWGTSLCLYLEVEWPMWDDVSIGDGVEFSSSFPIDCLCWVRNRLLLGAIARHGSQPWPSLVSCSPASVDEGTGSGVITSQRQEPDLISLFTRPHKLTMTSGSSLWLRSDCWILPGYPPGRQQPSDLPYCEGDSCIAKE